MTHITLELEDDFAQRYKNFCAKHEMTPSEAFNIIGRNAMDNEEHFTDKALLASEAMQRAIREAEEMERNPNAYPAYNTVEEMNAALDALDEAEDNNASF